MSFCVTCDGEVERGDAFIYPAQVESRIAESDIPDEQIVLRGGRIQPNTQSIRECRGNATGGVNRLLRRGSEGLVVPHVDILLVRIGETRQGDVGTGMCVNQTGCTGQIAIALTVRIRTERRGLS